MKIANGFVSNSSSSSFICCLTGEMNSGMDMSMQDLGFAQCRNGHVIDQSQVLGSETPIDAKREFVKEWLKNREESKDTSWYKDAVKALKIKDDDTFEEYFEDEWGDTYNDEGFDSINCPVCQFNDLPYEDVAKYFLTKNGITRKEFASVMKKNYVEYKNFRHSFDPEWKKEVE